jgi:hypothetical protein
MTTARTGPGRFQWNAGGWFGGQVGSTIWMIIAGVVLLARGVVPGIWLLVCFAATNVIGFVIWSRRDRIAPHPAIQCLLAVMAVATAIGLILLDIHGGAAGMPMPSWYYGVLLLFPAMMLQFAMQERASRDGREESAGDPD